MMHTYNRYTYPDGRTVFRVGIYDPMATREAWRMLREFENEDDAAAYVSFLNGGNKPTGQPGQDV